MNAPRQHAFPRRILLGWLCFLAACPATLLAQVVWDNTNNTGNDRWTTNANWSTNASPSGLAVQFNATAGTSATVENNELRGNWSITSLTFNNVDDTFAIINGNLNRTLTLSTGNITRTAGSSGTQTLGFTTLALGANSTMNIAGSGSLVISAVVQNSGGARSVNKTGAGELVLSGANTFSGGLTVSNGTVGFGANTAAGTGTLTLAGGSVYASGGARTLTNAVSITNDFGVSGANNLTFTGATSLGAATRTITTTNSGLTTFSGVVSGNGGINKEGSGTLVLSGANTFTGDIAANDGTLRIASDANLGNTANDLSLNGGTLETTGTMTLNAGRVVTVGTSGGTLDVNSGTTLTLGTAGQLTGSGSLTKADTGTLVVSAANAGYTGDTVLNGGITRLTGYDGLGTSATNTVTLNNGAELDANWGNGAINFQSSIVINDGIIRHTDANGNKAGFQNNSPTSSSLTINGNAQLIDQDGAAAGGFLTLDGAVTLNTGANVTANAVNATDEIRFGGAQNITLAAGSTLTTAGAGTVSFGSGAARTIIGEGTSAQQSTLVLGAATNSANAGTTFQVNGAGTGGLRVEGTKARVDALMTDARLATTTGSGGTLTLAYTAGGSRTLGPAANLASASAVALGLQSTGGTFTLGSAGGGTGDLDNWGGLVIGPATTATFADNYVFNATADLTLLGGTLSLNGTTQTFDTLTVSANSIIDFGGGNSVLNLTNLVIGAGVTLTVNNWADAADYFYTLGWAGASYDTYGAAPMNQVVFTGYGGSGNTHWREYNNEITPVPEPSTYGLLMLLGTGGFAAWRRRRRR